jgi:DNA-binding MarR family transcriptional regulator
MKKISVDPDLARLVTQTSRAHMAALLARLAERGFDVNPSFAQVMPWLDTKGIRVTALAQRVGVTKQAIGQLVQQLSEFDYVDQVQDPTDARAKMIRLTRRGVAANKVCAEMGAELNKAATDALGEKGLAKLNADLAKILALLQAMNKHATKNAGD